MNGGEDGRFKWLFTDFIEDWVSQVDRRSIFCGPSSVFERREDLKVDF